MLAASERLVIPGKVFLLALQRVVRTGSVRFVGARAHAMPLVAFVVLVAPMAPAADLTAIVLAAGLVVALSLLAARRAPVVRKGRWLQEDGDRLLGCSEERTRRDLEVFQVICPGVDPVLLEALVRILEPDPGRLEYAPVGLHEPLANRLLAAHCVTSNAERIADLSEGQLLSHQLSGRV